ncbi:ADP-ribose glycohydrolase MACROD1 isoform X1 [Scleropages formosus]|uniref:Mono-ADP ribosylhydrolase 1 n=1 Tax=Scleropages formosus TaxID=113540 RepID=A0A8C9R949_SCLFO|nr:ADP-ribose glycohydrolase MACROD1 isoform X1 [Scleropages formosus]
MAFQMSALATAGVLLSRGRAVCRAPVLVPALHSTVTVRSGRSEVHREAAFGGAGEAFSRAPFTALATLVPVQPALLLFGNSGVSASFSTSSAAPKGPRSSRGRRRCWALLAALGLSTTVGCLHSGTVSAAMASSSDSINLDSPDTDWKEAKKLLLSASPRERRRLYRVSEVLPLSQIPVWTPSAGQTTGETCYQVNEVLNSKISLFRGDITKLEVDAIVNAANKTLLGGGGVDGSIHRGAGPLLKKECATLGGCDTGQAKITGAYGLPAKYVIHTVGPIAQGVVGDREREELRNCYRNCLDTATQNQLRTVAFPCISTGVYGYPPDKAVDVALTVVREYLEKHPAQLDRVIFCVFLKSDEDLYQDRLPRYFPHGAQVKSKL